jgi:PAS domain S-box-containing protein
MKMPVSNAELFQQLTDVMPFGIYVIDRNRNIIFWNQVAYQITGYRAQEVVGRHCSEALLAHCSTKGEALCQKGLCPMALTLHDGNVRHAVVLLQHKEGYRVRILAQTVPVRDEEGKILAVGQVFQQESIVAGLLWDDTDLASHSHAEMRSPQNTEEQLHLHWLHERDSLSAFLITIEGLHEMGINRGPAFVQTVLQTVAKTFSNALWMPHFLGIWTNQRFILLVPRCDLPCREEIVRELQAITSTSGIMWWGDPFIPKIQIRMVSSEGFESPEKLLSSLDPTWSSSKLQPGDE